MRQLSATLLAEQRKPGRLPYVEAKVYDYEGSIARLSWTRLYTGTETDNGAWQSALPLEGLPPGLYWLRAAADQSGAAETNALVSPFSIANALGMLHAGAQGPTAAEIARLLEPATARGRAKRADGSGPPRTWAAPARPGARRP